MPQATGVKNWGTKNKKPNKPKSTFSLARLLSGKPQLPPSGTKLSYSVAYTRKVNKTGLKGGTRRSALRCCAPRRVHKSTRQS